MSTVIPFIPSNLFAPSFPVVLDGNDYTVTVTWNISAQRFYINIYALDGTWILTVPLFATPPSRMVADAVYDPLQRLMTITMLDSTQWPIPSVMGYTAKPGTIIEYTLEQFTPDAYNGKFRCIQVNDTTFTFFLAQDPGNLAIRGLVTRVLNMVAGVFVTSTLIYRNGAFEINP
jgi:hypothetical protein